MQCPRLYATGYAAVTCCISRDVRDAATPGKPSRAKVRVDVGPTRSRRDMLQTSCQFAVLCGASYPAVEFELERSQGKHQVSKAGLPPGASLDDVKVLIRKAYTNPNVGRIQQVV